MALMSLQMQVTVNAKRNTHRHSTASNGLQHLKIRPSTYTEKTLLHSPNTENHWCLKELLFVEVVGYNYCNNFFI